MKVRIVKIEKYGGEIYYIAQYKSYKTWFEWKTFTYDAGTPAGYVSIEYIFETPKDAKKFIDSVKNPDPNPNDIKKETTIFETQI